MRAIAPLALCVIVLGGTPALADRDEGREIFRKHCVGCHAIECNRMGPKLGGIINRKAGSISDFEGYSDALKDSGIVWTEENLEAYLADPELFIPKNAMAGFGKVQDDTDRQNLIQFLSAPDDSLDLCF